MKTTLVKWLAPAIVMVAVTASASMGPPRLIAPGATTDIGYTIENLTPTLRWATAPNAQYYRVAIFEDSAKGVVYEADQITGTSVSVPAGWLKEGTKYHWVAQSRATGSLGGSPTTVSSGFSDPLYFQTPSSGSTDSEESGCAGCAGAKSTFTLNALKAWMGDLFLTGLALAVLATRCGGRRA